MMHKIERVTFALRLLPKMPNSFDTIMCMIPKCSPDKARMCEAPLVRKTDVISFGMSARLPVRSAFISALVSEELNPMLSICVCISFPRISAYPESGDLSDGMSPERLELA